MSTLNLFVSDAALEAERERDRLQVRNAELVLVMTELQRWLRAGPLFRMTASRITPDGWDDARKLVDEALK